MLKKAIDKLRLEIGARLALVRKSTGKSQVEFARDLSVSQRAYITYELGERDLPTPVLAQLNEMLAVDPSWLVLGNGVRTRSEELGALEVAIIATLESLDEQHLKPPAKVIAKMIVDLFKMQMKYNNTSHEFAVDIAKSQKADTEKSNG